MTGKALSCDIFCAVVDNYGDIGVCWRLAKQLALEHSVVVRLWVDDLESFKRLCPEVDTGLPVQHCRGVEVRLWTAEIFHPHPTCRPPSPSGRGAGGEGTFSMIAADLVIEAFACELPEEYVVAMAQQKHKSVWLNLEYLSAEDWVGGCHLLPSPHPRLPLVKYFFFPGFTAKTGGLLLERDLLERRDAFQNDAQAQAEYWRGLGVPLRQPDELRVSLFSYENAALEALLETWTLSSVPITCLVPQGRILPQVAAFFGRELAAGDVAYRGTLRVQVLPLVEQERYDQLLWACDINFVRGEDSCVRAQWAGRPMVWHIYPQHDGVHMHKLRALSSLYGAGLPPLAAQASEALWLAWNGEGDMSATWQACIAQRNVLEVHAKAWSQQLSGNSLALNLLDFFRQVGRIRAFKIEGQ